MNKNRFEMIIRMQDEIEILESERQASSVRERALIHKKIDSLLAEIESLENQKDWWEDNPNDPVDDEGFFFKDRD